MALLLNFVDFIYRDYYLAQALHHENYRFLCCISLKSHLYLKHLTRFLGRSKVELLLIVVWIKEKRSKLHSMIRQSKLVIRITQQYIFLNLEIN